MQIWAFSRYVKTHSAEKIQKLFDREQVLFSILQNLLLQPICNLHNACDVLHNAMHAC